MHERERLGRRHQVASVANQIHLGDQSLDDRRARRGRAETAVAHGLAQFVVVHELARAFHRAEQRGFRVARRGLGDALLHLHVGRLDAFVGLHGRERRLFFGIHFLAVHFQPARLHHHLAGAFERLALDARDAHRLHKFCRRIKHREEPLRHHVEQLLLRLAQSLGQHARWHDGKVIADLRVVEDAFVRMHPALLENFFRERTVAREVAQRVERLLDRGDVIFRQRARVRSRVGQHLVLFVERLGQSERVLRAETEASVRLALERRQVVKQRRHLRRGLAFLGDDPGLAEALRANGFRSRLVPKPLRLCFDIAFLDV